MNLPYKLSFLIIMIFSGIIYCKAQESMLNDVDYVYLQKLIDTANIRYPNFKTYDHRIKVTYYEVKKAKLGWFDPFTLSLSYSPTNATSASAPTLSGYQIGFFLNIGNFVIKPHLIKQAKEQMAIEKLNKEDARLNLINEVKSRYFKYLQAKASLKLQIQMSSDIEGLLRQVKYKFEKGEETFENYSKALTNFASARQNIIATESNLLIAKSSLEQIIDKKLEDIH